MDAYFLVAFLHVILIAPFLLWVGFNRAATPDWAYSLLFGLGMLIVVYHGYKAFIKWKAQSPSLWVNLLHILLVAPLLLFIGSKGYDTPRWAFELLAMLGFASLGYHIYSIIGMVQDMGSSTKKKDSQESADDEH